jgi:hypothetical protein
VRDESATQQNRYCQQAPQRIRAPSSGKPRRAQGGLSRCINRVGVISGHGSASRLSQTEFILRKKPRTSTVIGQALECTET